MSDDNKGKEALFGRAVIDPDFRKRLLHDPEATIEAEGYTVEQDVIDQLKAMDAEAAEAAAQNVDEAFAERRAAS